jgi:hypothetical protein
VQRVLLGKQSTNLKIDFSSIENKIIFNVYRSAIHDYLFVDLFVRRVNLRNKSLLLVCSGVCQKFINAKKNKKINQDSFRV